MKRSTIEFKNGDKKPYAMDYRFPVREQDYEALLEKLKEGMRTAQLVFTTDRNIIFLEKEYPKLELNTETQFECLNVRLSSAEVELPDFVKKGTQIKVDMEIFVKRK